MGTHKEGKKKGFLRRAFCGGGAGCFQEKKKYAYYYAVYRCLLHVDGHMRVAEKA